jgi:NTP pyrophosphatase (non-canonical NTP hydrolase)
MRLNDFHRANIARQHEAFAPAHPLMALVACVQEEVGELAGAVLGVTGEKAHKAHKTREDVLDAVADAMTYLSLVAGSIGCDDLEGLLSSTFNAVSRRAGSSIFVDEPQETLAAAADALGDKASFRGGYAAALMEASRADAKTAARVYEETARAAPHVAEYDEQTGEPYRDE